MSEKLRTYLVMAVALAGLGATFVAWGHQIQAKPFVVAKAQVVQARN